MRDLTSGNIYKNFLLFAIPMVLSGILSQSYSIVDTVIAGKLLGDEALAGIGATSPLTTFFEAIFWGIACGIGILVANQFGAKKYYELKTTVINSLIFTLAFILLLSFIIFLFRKNIFDFLNVAPSVLHETDVYFSIIILGNAAIIFNVMFLHIINALGDGSFPFVMSLISSAINIFGNIFTVKTLKMGISGLAISTVMSSFIVDVCYVFKLKKNFAELIGKGSKIKFSFKTVKKTYAFSVPMIIQQSVMYFSSFILSPMVNSIGYAASASYTVTLRIYNFNSAVYQNSSKTIGNYIGQCFGAKKYDKINKGLWIGVLQGIIFLMPVLLFCCFFPDTVCSYFYKTGSDRTSFNYSIMFLRYYMPFIVFNLLANAFHNYFRGINRMKPLVIATFCGSVMRIIVTMILVPKFQMNGVFAGWIASWVFDGVFGFILYKIDNSKKLKI